MNKNDAIIQMFIDELHKWDSNKDALIEAFNRGIEWQKSTDKVTKNGN